MLNIRFVVLWLLLTGLPALATEQNVRPGINDHYLADPDYRQWVRIFESPGREVFDRREQIIEALAIAPGMDIADIGAGTGLFTRAFSSLVGDEGTVYAVDIAPNFIEGIMQQKQAAGVTNVTGIVNDPRSTGLEADSIDMAFVCDTYHHFEYPFAMLQSMHRALRPGGSLVIIDFRKRPGFSSAWVMSHTRADRQQVIEEVESEGFRLVEENDMLRTNYFLRFVKL